VILAASGAGSASAWAETVDLTDPDAVAALAARYRELSRRIDEIDHQTRVLDVLIDRVEDLDRYRGRGAAAPGAASAAAAASDTPAEPPATVAADRREELEAQQSMPDLPRVSPDVGGVLTPKGRLTLEPSWSYTYSSTNRVAIEGFTILPALLVGVIDVVEADRQNVVAGFSARYGITNRLELELKQSYIYRQDSTRSREFLTDAVEDSIFDAEGQGPGDYEVGFRYQFKRRNPTSPYVVGNLRFKAASGTDPFALATQSTLTGDPQFASELPTGSGFRTVSPSLTLIYPSDPVVFFGSLGYLWTEPDDKGTWLDEDNRVMGFGLVDPGNAARLSFGLGLGLNDRSSLSISYQLDQFSKTWIETAAEQRIPGSDITVGKLLVGYSLRTQGGAPLNLAFGIGATSDAPDTDLTFRMPFDFR
jgi:hypothetical protein